MTAPATTPPIMATATTARSAAIRRPISAFPPASLTVLPAPASGGVTYPALFYRASHPLHAWHAAQPRAPPAA